MAQKDKGNIRYTPLSDATPESDLDALATVYAFVLECHENKKVADSTDDPNEVKEDEEVDPRQKLP